MDKEARVDANFIWSVGREEGGNPKRVTSTLNDASKLQQGSQLLYASASG